MADLIKAKTTISKDSRVDIRNARSVIIFHLYNVPSKQ
jgi:hypothetical protein